MYFYIFTIAAKRVFGLFNGDEWSSLIVSIRRVHSIRQFKDIETNQEVYFKYGPSVFKKNSRTYLFNRSKSINAAIKECEDDFFSEYGKRKRYNKTFDDPHFMEYYLDYKCVVYK